MVFLAILEFFFSFQVIPSFSFSYNSVEQLQKQRFLISRIKHLYMLTPETSKDDSMEQKNRHGIPSFGIGHCDLSLKWHELVRTGQISATTVLKDDTTVGEVVVKYGVRLDDELGLSEYVLLVDDEHAQTSKAREMIHSINGTLTEMQQQQRRRPHKTPKLAIQCIYDGDYTAQLQLVRTLRPPRSKQMDGSSNYKTSCKVSCTPPKYDVSNSFLVGPLRLYGKGDFHGAGEPRICMERLVTPFDPSNKSTWDIYHNISPVDPRGHFLLLPTFQNKANWRDQSLTKTDCCEMTNLASTINPFGSLILTFNSVGAGASQNHIHCHGWVCPSPPSLERNTENNNLHGYAVTKAKSSCEVFKLPYGTVVSLLDYPCTCIKLSILLPKLNDTQPPGLKEMGDSIASIVQLSQKIEAPHNVAWTNEPGNSEDGGQTLNVFIFFRSKGQSTIPTNADDEDIDSIMRCGASEMLGLFHTSSKSQLHALARNKGVMESILEDISWEPREELWKIIQDKLSN